jgi:hypothetical protein
VPIEPAHSEKDYRFSTPELIQHSKDIFLSAIAQGDPKTHSFLTLAHDIHEQTAFNLTETMLQAAISKGYRPVTVGECLGDPHQNWYIPSAGSTFTSRPADKPASPTPSPTGVSTDGKCGSAGGATCSGSKFGSCCSKYNFW